ncbi:MAG: hypothetical protein WBO08_02630 [Mycobacterium sp.]|nr:hypothetical protein [Mycobacterium sp.]
MAASWIPTTCLTVAAAAGAILLALSPSADAAPKSDSQGYLDSTARCASPSTAVIFGSTESSRVAICEKSDGTYEYRGVRVRDGARLVLPATRTGSGYVAENDGLSYTVTSASLVVSSGDEVVRDEPLLDVHKPGGSGALPEPVTTATSTTPSTSMTPTTSTTPLPPPLPAEVGAG